MPKASVVFGSLQIALDHFADQVFKADFGPPTQPLTGLTGVSQKRVNFGRPEITRVDLDEDLPRVGVDPLFVDTASAPDDGTTDVAESPLHEFADGMRFARREDKIVRFGLLQHQPHAAGIVPRVAPVSGG